MLENNFLATKNPNKTLDCVSIGRANVDLYPPVGEKLQTARSYDVFVGGSPANIAVGMVKRGLRSGIITRVADDEHGYFVVDYLKNLGLDISCVQWDNSGAKTSLAFAERRQNSATLMYRNNSADLHLNKHEISKEYIKSAKLLFVSGTALVSEVSRQAVYKAIQYAEEGDVFVALDIDYRAYGWKSEKETADVLSEILPHCHIILGTREEFDITSYIKEMSDEDCAKRCFKNSNTKLVIIKHGEAGSHAFLPDGTNIKQKAIRVEPVKPWGAGDAFASSCVASLILGKSLKDSLQDGAASASITITGNSCTEAMPTSEELEKFLTNIPSMLKEE